MIVVLKGSDMKKILVLIGMIFITCAANAQVEYYTSVKLAVGGTTIYVDDNQKLGDYLATVSGAGYKYDGSGLLLGISPAVGIDWSPNKMYVNQHPYGWFHLRLEGELGYNRYDHDGKLRYDYQITDEINVKLNHLFALANGYADFKIDKVVPYVGLGVGYSFGKAEVTVVNDEYGERSDSDDDSGFIYAMYLGVGYKYSDITTFDLGYRRVYAPTRDDGLYVFSTLRLGARFRI